MNTQEQQSCAPVPVNNGAQQAQETRSRWEWVEASVWTGRMLKALEQGVKGNKWFRLIDSRAQKFYRLQLTFCVKLLT